jgi:hypothetical protein
MMKVIRAFRDCSKAPKSYIAVPKLAAVTSLKIKVSIRFTYVYFVTNLTENVISL